MTWFVIGCHITGHVNYVALIIWRRSEPHYEIIQLGIVQLDTKHRHDVQPHSNIYQSVYIHIKLI